MTRVDPTNSQIVYQEYTGVSLRVSTDGGSSFTSIASGIVANAARFYAPYALDASGGIYFGEDYLNFSSNHGASWTQIGSPGTNNFNPSDYAIDAVAVSSTNNNVVYVSAGGHIFVTQNAQAGGSNVSWAQIDLPGGRAARTLDSLAVDPTDASGGTAYAVVNSFTGVGDHVFMTTNFGMPGRTSAATCPISRPTPSSSTA